MKFEWEIGDIRTGRRIWCASGASNGELIIGYNNEDREYFPPSRMTREEQVEWENNKDPRYCVVSQADGMVYTSGRTKTELVDWLNDAGYKPTTLEEKYMRYRLVPETSA